MNKNNIKQVETYIALWYNQQVRVNILLEKQLFHIDQFNTFQYVKEKVFARIIILGIRDSTFKLQVHISKYHQQLKPFKKAMFFLTQNYLQIYQMDITDKLLYPLKLLKLYILLQFQQLFIVIEKDDQIDQFIVIQKEIERQVINASVENKIVQNFHMLII
ncbi:unnamed protein product [Paramecium pentaurelia]|uniref:Uncharacterized protein n=1 Tax=Paramecium pentaurelia TaxID=43138 RepID=A0A8S1V3J9_9CILI|nr:unnamed protein product [Paramecium pentaurelia]CAD8170394.1 unnamed protein product [Paramecium pentaurelia]